jgi:hypothetical protein
MDYGFIGIDKSQNNCIKIYDGNELTVLQAFEDGDVFLNGSKIETLDELSRSINVIVRAICSPHNK